MILGILEIHLKGYNKQDTIPDRLKDTIPDQLEDTIPDQLEDTTANDC